MNATDALRETVLRAQAQITPSGLLDESRIRALARKAPLVGWLIAGKDASMAVRDLLLARKAAAFLSCTLDVPDSDRHAFGMKMEADPAFAERVTEIVLETLDKVSRVERGRLLGNAFRALLSGDVDESAFNECAELLERLTDNGLGLLEHYYASKWSDRPLDSDDDTPELVTYGLLHRALSEPERVRSNGGYDMDVDEGKQSFVLERLDHAFTIARALGLGTFARENVEAEATTQAG